MILGKYEKLAGMRPKIMCHLELYKFCDSDKDFRLSDAQKQENNSISDFLWREMSGGCFITQFIREMHENMFLSQDLERAKGFYKNGIRNLLIPDIDIPDVNPVYCDPCAIWGNATLYNDYLNKWVIPQLEKELAIYDNQSDMPSLQTSESGKEDDEIKTADAKCPDYLAEIFDKLVECGQMKKRGEKWEWIGKKGLYGYFIHKLCNAQNLKDDRDYIPWKMFEPYIVNAWKIKTTARQTVNDYTNKCLPPPQGDTIIDSLLAKY